MERHERVEHEWRGVEFERRVTEFKRIGVDYDRRGVEFERIGVEYDRKGAEFGGRRWACDERFGCKRRRDDWHN